MADSSFSDDVVLIQGPSFHVDLAPLDARHPVHYSRRLLIFRCTSSTQRDAQLAAFKSGLQALVSRCPILGGIVVPLPPDEARNGKEDWRTIVPDKGLELVVRDLRTKISSFEKLEAAEFPSYDLPFNLLMPIPEELGNDRPFATCKVQFSVIEGGTIIAYAMSHSVADGIGNNEIFRVLSEETRLAQEKSIAVVANEIASTAVAAEIGLDRSILRNMTSEVLFKIEDHPAYRWELPALTYAPPPEKASADRFEATAPEVPVVLRISAACLTRLKADATLPGAPPISMHDAMCGLMWRSLLLIRSRRSGLASEVLSSTMGQIFMPSDARRHVSLPQSYVGNCVYQLIAELDLGTLLSSSGLQHAASALRRAITYVNPVLVSSYMAMLKDKWAGWQFMTTYATTGLAMGSDWSSGVLYGQDWGNAFGPLIRYRYPGGDAFNCIMPKLPDGGAEVIMGVMPDEVEVLRGKECFGKYLEVP